MSYNKLLGQLQAAGNTTTVARYLDLLSDAGLVTALFRYTPAPHLGRASPRKLNVLNTALMTAPSGYTFEEARADRSYWGRIVESAVGAHLYNTRSTATRLHFWRNPPHEVDFVIARGPHLLGIEVKSGRPRRRSGLDAFADRFPNAKTVVVGPGGIPPNEFLSLSADDWLEEI
jgi:predicted AAA+ superfamily ATPase